MRLDRPAQQAGPLRSTSVLCIKEEERIKDGGVCVCLCLFSFCESHRTHFHSMAYYLQVNVSDRGRGWQNLKPVSAMDQLTCVFQRFQLPKINECLG